MTDAIDPISIKWTKVISKMTGGFVLGKRDPISRILGVDQKSIQERLDGQKPQKQQVLADPVKPRAKQPQMEADKDRQRSVARSAGVVQASEDRNLLRRKRGRQGASRRLAGG